ncbi:MAG: sugar phosphate nucleotidyltransferase, partial [bacterium]|nr:sugar phosphate nucleotidyltransferase [bacterium]
MMELKKLMSGSKANQRKSKLEFLLLAGGEGTRLKPLTLKTPKHLLKIAGKEVLSYTIGTLPKNSRLKILAGYMSEKYIEFAKKINAEVVVESQPKGTGGAVRDALEKPAYILNADIYAKIPFKEIESFYKEKKADLIITVARSNDVRRFGVVIFDKNKKIKNFLEKPKHIKTGFINVGVYFAGENFIDFIKKFNKTPLSIEKDVFPLAVKKLNVYAYVVNTDFIDFGTPASFIKLMKKIIKRPSIRGSFSGKINGVCDIYEGAVVKNSTIEDSIIMENTYIEDSFIYNSIIGTDVIIEKNCIIKNMIVCDGSILRNYSIIYENTRAY